MRLDMSVLHRNISLIPPHKRSIELKTLKPFNLAHEQYQLLMVKFKATRDIKEKNMLSRRLTNLLAVMEFLISLHKTQ